MYILNKAKSNKLGILYYGKQSNDSILNLMILPIVSCMYLLCVTWKVCSYVSKNKFKMTERILKLIQNCIFDYHIKNNNIYIYSDVMKTIRCAYPPHHHNGFVVTCRLWTASGGVRALLVLEPTECSTSTRLGA